MYKRQELTAYYQELQKKYPTISIEDGCAENDWLGWEPVSYTHLDVYKRQGPGKDDSPLNMKASWSSPRRGPTPSPSKPVTEAA